MSKRYNVSIHAPVWGATIKGCFIVCKNSFNPRTRVGCDLILRPKAGAGVVSIHAPVWGATNKYIRLIVSRRFNPRTRVGCDITPPKIPLPIFVSIHAPVWGATHFTSLTCVHIWFQSTHPCGVRPDIEQKLVEGVLFQSTHPCGVRRYQDHQGLYARRFNPRTRVGCDVLSKRC